MDHAVRVGDGGVWVLSGEALTLTQVDPADAEVVGDTSINHSPADVPDSLEVGFRTVWVGASPGIDRVDPIDGDHLRAVRLDQGATVAIGAGRVWAIASGTLYRVDPASATVEEEVDLDVDAFDMAVGFGGIWIVDELDSTVTRVDIETLTPDPPIALGGDLTDVEAGAGAVWVVDERGVVIELDPDTGRSVGPIRVGSEPTDAAIGLGAVWVTNRGDGTISKIDPLTGDETSTIDVGAPVAAIDADGGRERSGSSWPRGG